MQDKRLAYLNEFLEAFSLPEEARDCLLGVYGKVLSDSQAQNAFFELVSKYEKDMFTPWEELLQEVEAVADRLDLSADILILLFLIFLTEALKSYYTQAGLDEKIWRDTIADLKYKAVENKLVYGVWGVVDRAWFCRFFQMRRFGFDLLQFEIVKFKGDEHYKKNGVTLTKDDDVINVHIPRTGGKLEYSKVLKSYRLASAFFADYFKGKKVVFVCKSWMLFPRNKEFLAPDSNLALFISDFEVLSIGYYDDYSWCWRIFNTKEKDLNKLPRTTSLQRRYVDLMKRGEKTGWAYGIFIFE